VKVPCSFGGADDVVSALNDSRRYVTDSVDVVQYMRVTVQESTVYEIMPEAQATASTRDASQILKNKAKFSETKTNTVRTTNSQQHRLTRNVT